MGQESIIERPLRSPGRPKLEGEWYLQDCRPQMRSRQHNIRDLPCGFRELLPIHSPGFGRSWGDSSVLPFGLKQRFKTGVHDMMKA